MISSAGTPDHARGLHVFLVLLDQRRSRARCARTAPSPLRPIATDDHEQIAILSCSARRQDAARDAVDQQRDQDRREGQLHVGDAHDQASTQPPT
jgi:hypothetical protein